MSGLETNLKITRPQPHHFETKTILLVQVQDPEQKILVSRTSSLIDASIVPVGLVSLQVVGRVVEFIVVII